jgi:hypothetical protein
MIGRHRLGGEQGPILFLHYIFKCCASPADYLLVSGHWSVSRCEGDGSNQTHSLTEKSDFKTYILLNNQSNMQANKFVLNSKPKGLPKVSDFSIEKESLRPLENEGNVSHFTSFAFPQYLVKPK